MGLADGTTNPGVTWKLDNPLKGIRNPISPNPDNPLKGQESSTKRNLDPVAKKVNRTNLE